MWLFLLSVTTCGSLHVLICVVDDEPDRLSVLCATCRRRVVLVSVVDRERSTYQLTELVLETPAERFMSYSADFC